MLLDKDLRGESAFLARFDRVYKAVNDVEKDFVRSSKASERVAEAAADMKQEAEKLLLSMKRYRTERNRGGLMKTNG